MSLARSSVPVVTSILPFLRVTPSRSSAHRLCFDCLRTHQTRQQLRQPTRRTIASATEHRPQTLDPQPPPRNAGVQDTSIAGGKQSVDDMRSVSEQRHPQTPSSSTQTPSSSIPEGEAQQPKQTPNKGEAVGSVASPEQSPKSAGTSRPQRKSKLRPRKAAMTLSSKAVYALRELLDQPEPKLIRVGVKNRGCSGLAYHLEYVDKPGPFDEAVDQDGVKVLVDSKALFSIIGSEMDWVEDKLSRRFVFKNPNITEQCGCGESFSIG